MTKYSFPLNEDGWIPEDAKFRVLKYPLSAGDLAPEDIRGKIWARRGDVITWYEGARKYPDLVQLMVDRGQVEYVAPPPQPKVKVIKAVEPEEDKE